MKFGFFADAHVDNHGQHGGATKAGINDRCRLVLDTVRQVILRAMHHGCHEVWSLGDLFNGVKPTPQIIHAVEQILALARDGAEEDPSSKLYLRFLLGNHELVSTETDDNALVALSPMLDSLVQHPAIITSGTETAPVEMWAVPSMTGMATTTLPAALEELAKLTGRGPGDVRRLLLLHLGIEHGDTPPYLCGSADAVPLKLVLKLAEQYGFTAVFAGNWHKRWIGGNDKTVVVQVGGLCPRGWNDPGADDYGTFLVYDSDTDEVSWEEVPGPRFMMLRGREQSAEGLKPLVTSPNVTALFVRQVVPPGAEGERAKEVLADLFVANNGEDGVPIFSDVVPDEEEALAAARTAAAAVRGADTLEQAVAGFVAEMPLPEGVDRAAVGARVMALLTEVGRASA